MREYATRVCPPHMSPRPRSAPWNLYQIRGSKARCEATESAKVRCHRVRDCRPKWIRKRGRTGTIELLPHRRVVEGKPDAVPHSLGEQIETPRNSVLTHRVVELPLSGERSGCAPGCCFAGLSLWLSPWLSPTDSISSKTALVVASFLCFVGLII